MFLFFFLSFFLFSSLFYIVLFFFFTFTYSFFFFFFFFNDTAPTEISPLPLHDALPISVGTAQHAADAPTQTAQVEGGVHEHADRRAERDPRRAEPAHEQPGECRRDDERQGRDLHRRTRAAHGVEPRREQLHRRLTQHADPVRGEDAADEAGVIRREPAGLVQRGDDLPAQRDARDGRRHHEIHDSPEADGDPRSQLLVGRGPSPPRGRLTRQLRQRHRGDRDAEQTDGQDLDQLRIAKGRDAAWPRERAEQRVDEPRELGDPRPEHQWHPREQHIPHALEAHGWP